MEKSWCVTLPLLALRARQLFQLADPMSCGGLIEPESLPLACALLLSQADSSCQPCVCPCWLAFSGYKGEKEAA